MEIAYYPGCSLHSTGIEYDISTRKVCEAAGITLVEIKDWICCGSSPVHNRDPLLSVALPCKNFLLLKATGDYNEICVPCASCFSRMKSALHDINDVETKEKVEEIIDAPCPEGITVLHILDVLIDKIGIESISQKIEKELKGMSIASYYGCLITRPPAITGSENFENPDSMDRIVSSLGGEPVDWNMKTFCCGASLALNRTDVMLDMVKRILQDAVSAGAEAITVACPLCHNNLDTRQQQINRKYGTNFNIPVFYITELIGLAMGIKPRKLGIYRHLQDARGFLKKRGLA